MEVAEVVVATEAGVEHKVVEGVELGEEGVACQSLLMEAAVLTRKCPLTTKNGH